MTDASTNAEFRAITRRLYELVSTPPGQQDWDSVRELYHPRATLVRTGVDGEGRPFVLAMTLDEYAENVSELLHDAEFSEVEIRQDVTVFGNVAALVSVYEYSSRQPGARRRGRGVNFFNLVREGGRWKIMNIVWDNERDGVSLGDAGLLDSPDKEQR